MNIKCALVILVALPFAATSGAASGTLLWPNSSGDGAAFDEFGRYVEQSNQWLMVGVPSDDEAGENSGAVYVFDRSNLISPFQVIRLSPPAGLVGFGTRISLNGIRLAAASSLGIHVYEFDGTSWQTFRFIPKAGPEHSCGSFSHPEINGDWLSVGCLGTAHDRLLLYRYGGAEFDYVGSLDPPQGRSGIGFGYSVDLSGSFAVIGATGWRDASQVGVGAAFLYEIQPNNTWSNIGRLTASDGQADDSFANEVRICGLHVVVAARSDDTIFGMDSGSVYRFDLSPGDQASSLKFAGIVRSGANFGYSLACDNERVAVGALLDRDGLGSGSTGTVTVLNLTPTFGTESFKIAPTWLRSGPEIVGDFFGADVEIDGDFLAVGLPYRAIDVPIQVRAGAVFIDTQLWLLFRDGFE